MPTEGTPTGAQATPDMVAKLAQTEEVMMTKDGTRPLTPEEQAGNSPVASIEGAQTETAAPGTEVAPAPASTPTPAPTAPNTLATDNPSQAPVLGTAGTPVPVVTAATAPTVASSAQTVTATPPPVVETPGLDQLAAFVKETQDKATASIEEARRVAQGQTDRQTSLVNKQLEAAKEATLQVRTKMHDLEVRDLNPEDRAKAVTAFEQQDERAELDRIRDELTVTHRGVFIDSLVLEYSALGITRESIESAGETPEAMELWCEQQKSSILQAKLDAPESAPLTQVPTTPVATVVAPSQVVAAVTPTPSPAAAAPDQPVPTAAANAPGAAAAAVPAGATAPSDIGSTGAAAEAWKPTEESGSDAMKQNIQHMGWERVQIPS